MNKEKLLEWLKKEKESAENPGSYLSERQYIRFDAKADAFQDVIDQINYMEKTNDRT